MGKVLIRYPSLDQRSHSFKQLCCLGVQGKSVGSVISLYDCDENSELQKWECKNETVLALKGQELYIDLTADNTAVLSRTIGPNNHLTITGTPSGACSRTAREHYTIGGNAYGRTCMFPFHYKDHWYSSCTDTDSSNGRLWCGVETAYTGELWGYCPTTSKEHWTKHITTGAYYQLNTQSALTWSQAETSCKQQGASLLSITDPHQQAYVTGKLTLLWTGLVLDPEHGWQWSNGKPYRYLNWDSAPEAEFCSSPWIPYNGHCFFLNRTEKTWTDAQRACRKEGGDLVSLRNVEDQSFVISQLGYASTDQLWIGLNDRRTEGLFDWSDHSTVSFTSWEYGKPAVSTDQEDCVLIKGENGNWADRTCGERHGYICMKAGASEPSRDEVVQNIGCKTGWKRHGSYCYFVGTATKTFDEANAACKSSDSYLADVSNGVDNAFLVSLVGMRPEKHFWLGLSNQKNIEHFVWTNKDTVKYTHWNAEMPGHHQGCVAMTTGIFAGLWDVLPCTNTSKYICKHLAEGASPTPALQTVPPPQCADGWKRVASRNFCYKLHSKSSSQRKSWYEARDYCRAIGGDLLSIHSAVDIQEDRRYSDAWIGLSAPDTNNGYVWSDGSPVNYQHWDDNEPNNHNNAESCAELRLYKLGRGGSWNDAQCEKPNGWLCQIRAGKAYLFYYNMTSDGWLEWKGSQYYINDMTMAMEDARHFCKQRHGDLVTINSEEERVFLWKQISKKYGSFWIGLTVDLDGTFDVMFLVLHLFTGFWHNYNCGNEFRSLCKRDASPPVNATVAPTVPPKGGCRPPWIKFNSKVRDPSLPDSAEPTISSDYVRIFNDTIKVVTQPMTWDAAKTHCEDDDAKLASIRNEWTQAYVELLALNLKAPLWIGLNRNKTKGLFRFIDGWFMSFTRWAYNEPSRERFCVYVDVDGKWKTAHCNQTMNSVCMKSTDVPPTESSEHPGVCPEDPDLLHTGRNYFWQPFKGYCYIFFTESKRWSDAAHNCVTHGGWLTSIEDPSEQEFIENNMKIFQDSQTFFWTGLYKNHKGEWLWLDGTVMDYTNWGEGQPTDHSYGGIATSDGKWKASYQRYNRPYICKTPKGKLTLLMWCLNHNVVHCNVQIRPHNHLSVSMPKKSLKKKKKK
uniref:Mannose receptor, C type 1b n=1 Tax=Sparus aurata TaxID=8175 RepID=A0A671U397_SPAAU